MKHSYIQVNEGQLLFKHQLIDVIAEVREHKNYRWLATKQTEQSPLVFQSLIKLDSSTQLVLPYTCAMTLFLLWQPPKINLLNLGMGIGSIELALQNQPMSITSVEQSKDIAEIAKKYFKLPNKTNLHIDSAASFLNKTTHTFDVILCDIFNSQDHSKSIFKHDFYQALKVKLNHNGVLFLNLMPKDAEQLKAILILIRRTFTHVVLIEFQDYKNIVLIISEQQIPDKQQLFDANDLHIKSHDCDFKSIIDSMLYIPVKKSQS